MTDVFYLNSPRRSGLFKNRANLKARLKIGGRKRAAKMNVPPQHVDVVHFDEPTFCPNDLSSIFPHLPPGNSLLPSASPRNVEMAASIPEIDVERLTSEPLRQRTLHPRPYSADIWEEEEERRTRFALADDEEVDVLRQQRLQASQSSRHSGQQTDSVAALNHLTERNDVSRSSAVERNDRSDHEPQEPQRRRALAGAQHIQLSPVSHFVDYGTSGLNLSFSIGVTTEDQHMTVDDPRRSYDFADFVLKWRLKWLNGIYDVPPFEAELQPSIVDCGATEDVAPTDVVDADVDLQGLDWNLLGPTRDDALAARALLHPLTDVVARNGGSTETSSSHSSSNGETIHDEQLYRFRAFLPQHRANFSHYQLRHNLAANNRNDIFYAKGSRVMHTSLACPSSVNPVMDLSKRWNNITQFQITCLANNSDLTFSDYQSDNVLIAGGFYGDYAIRNLALEAGGRHHEGCVTNSHNGLINFVEAKSDRLSGLLKATFCSNDRKVRMMDIQTLRFSDCFAYDNTINCCSTSQDRRLRALVGDSHETLITNADNGDVLVTLKEHKDHSFSCAWSPDSRYLATSAQDNRVVVWDARKWDEPLHKFHNIMSCPRTLHFADDGTLIVAEDDDVVSVYDAVFNSRQDIRFFGSIAGLELLDGGAEMVVANADRSVGGLLSFQKTSTGLNRSVLPNDRLDGRQTGRQRLPYLSCGIDVIV